ncbi:MAG: hypothetical protein JSV62_16505 [Promethearchaeota archaeon]|nr:MAG: hypothetical protein JSV62_16505 [Candidatus Lokiarchaeota archaeon]
MRFKNLTIYLILIISVCFFIPNVKANIVLLGPRDYGGLLLPLIPLLYLLTLAIEFPIIYMTLEERRFKVRDIFKIIAIINLLTNPIAQIFGVLFMYIAPNFLYYFIILIEVLAILLEGLLLIDYINRNLDEEYFKTVQSKIKLIFGLVIANIISMLLGFIPLLVNYIFF